MSAPATTQPLQPLTSEQREEIALAKKRAKAVRRAAGVANINGWVTAVIAVLSAPFAPFSVVGFLVTAGLAIVAYNEFRGRKRLLDFDPGAAAFLGWNQIGLLSLIVAYCLWMMFSGPGSLSAELQRQPELAAAVGSPEIFDELFRYVVIGFYGTVILLSVMFQGLNAFYYFTRHKHIARYLQETPVWVREIA
jgi:hypothetical protein